MTLRNMFMILMCVLSTGCLQTENSSSFDGAAPDGSPEFLVANEILINKCSACHQEYTSYNESDYVTVNLAVPGDPVNSEIYYRIIGSSGPNGMKNMPTAGSITAGEVQAIFDWVTSIP